MAWEPSLYQEHFKELTKQLNRQAFWKTALFGVILLERQWPVYERLSVGREWGAAREVRKVLDRLWKGVPSGIRIDDKYLLMLEENPVEPLTEIWDPVAACMVSGGLSLIHIFRNKDKKAAGILAENNLKCLSLFLEACKEDCVPDHVLAAEEVKFQKNLCSRLCAVPNGEKLQMVSKCREEDHGNLLGEHWFSDYPDYKPLKRRAKKEPALRYTHLRYDEFVKGQKQSDDTGMNAWDREKRMLKLYDIWLNWTEKMPDHCDLPEPLIQHATHRWHMPEDFAEIYDYFALHYLLAARSCWACTEDAAQVRGILWLSARSQEACYALLERGWPCSKYLSAPNSLHRNLSWSALCAVCAGDWDLAVGILKRYHKPFKIRGQWVEWRYADVSRIWLALIQGEDDNARLLLERLEETENYPQFQMLLDRDVKGLEKYIIKEIRNMRKAFENYSETLAVPEIALLKLAKRRGLELNLPPVSEIPAGLLKDTDFDLENWKLPGQERLDEALGADGEQLLSKWQLWAKKNQETTDQLKICR